MVTLDEQRKRYRVVGIRIEFTKLHRFGCGAINAERTQEKGKEKGSKRWCDMRLEPTAHLMPCAVDRNSLHSKPTV
ncbi:hypothetical protein BHE74_00025154 [Ensete ventricosum]|nr:hypothetical protein GW17_00051012 [Ensete ventricosum]RWW67406.1 hypothetical protein BHE74_00025154 [Ensete ventricosum]RZR98713.1 hypothetical protein BHM03_00028134 [Ensete ventricosum]